MPAHGIPVLPCGRPVTPERDDLLARAAALVGALRERGVQTDRERRLPDATVADLRAAGLWDLVRPREHGGLECDTQTLADVIAELARGCGSTAWVCAIVNAVSFGVGTMPAAVREEIFASGLPGCSPLNPRAGGTARRVHGGIHVEHGEWPWASGSQIAGWALPRVTVLGDDGRPVAGLLAAVPIAEVEILDEWHTTAMRGTASNVVVLHDVTIPDHRTADLAALLGGEHLPDTPPAYRQPWLAFVFAVLAPVAVGLARAALELFVARTDGRPVPFTDIRDRRQAPRTHRVVGEAAAKTDAAALLVHRAAATLDDGAASGEQASVAIRARVRSDIGAAVGLARDAVALIYEEAGASAITEADPLARVARDIHATVMHAATNPATNAELYGQVLCGLEPSTARAGRARLL